MDYKLFLDDTRDPPDKSWFTARNYTQFCGIIKTCGLPDIISFDHDLGEDIAIELVKKGISKKKARMKKKESQSGYDCAKWLINYCINSKNPLPRYTVHSMNPVGKQNIISLLENFKK